MLCFLLQKVVQILNIHLIFVFMRERERERERERREEREGPHKLNEQTNQYISFLFN